MFKELKNGFYNNLEKCYCIDGWLTNNQDEEGKVLARVYRDKVEYTNPKYADIPEIKTLVEEAKSRFISME